LVKAGYHVVMRTRYRRYIGEFVLHCHILDHEDQGMMQNVRIAIPDGAGGVTAGHH
jgi:FtsP/CotA-like multicopper oxidase with cupredoxin domain